MGCQTVKCKCGKSAKACKFINGMCPTCYAASIKK